MLKTSNIFFLLFILPMMIQISEKSTYLAEKS